MIRLVLVLALAGCAPRTEAGGAAGEQASDPTALALHQRLLAAADAGDVAGFKALLTPGSVALLDEYFAAVRALPSEQAPRGWKGFVALHAALPERARGRAAYPVALLGEEPRLDLAAHPDAAYFREVISKLGP